MKFFDITLLEFNFALFLSIVNAFLLTAVSYKFFQILQVGNYHVASYFDWLKKSKLKFLSRICMLCFLSTACLVVTNFIFNNFKDIRLLSYLGLIFYFYFTSVYVKNACDTLQKTPLRYTRRMNRIVALCFVLFAVSTFFLMVLSYKYTNIFSFAIIALTPLLVPFMIPLCHFLLIPLEMLINNFYLSKATKKLKENKNLIKIGITGSYAKTSTKDILKTILSQKYKVCYTPKSYNTLMGVSKTINNYLKPDDEVFICEMGATYKMDIAKLVKIVDPSITILTGIANQHILTFKTIENVIETKYEIVKYSKPNATCIFNGNNENAFSLYKRPIENKEKILIKNDDENSLCQAKNVNFTVDYTSFDLYVNNENYGNVQTKLHGSYSVENILMAVAVCYTLGLSKEQIIKGIACCEQTDHRLKVTTNENNITIIDDSFNANEIGTKRALEYLSLYKDRRKIVMTPGLVDLGKLEREINYEFGKQISQVADISIIVNLNAREELTKGLIDNGFDKNKIILCDCLEDAKNQFSQLLISGDVLLICNDLPDIYI